MAWEVNTTIKEGIINLNKPAGMTSHDCVNMLRRLTGIKKIGHTGTLDPNATGVLPLCIGTSARINEYLDLDYKTYRCTMILGMTTDTQDIWGTVETDCRQELLACQHEEACNQSPAEKRLCDDSCGRDQNFCGQGESIEKNIGVIKRKAITETDIMEAFAEFSGVISQYPPKYSAIRVNGRRLYQYARDGIEVDIKPRTVYIDRLTVNEINFNTDSLEVVFMVTCSKGTYIRSICRDVGDKLECGAVMTALERTASGAFSIENAVTLEELQMLRIGEDVRDPETGRYTSYARADSYRLNEYILPADFPLVHFGKAVIDEERGRWFTNGGHIAMKEAIIEKKPEYQDKTFPLDMREEFKHAYNIYCRYDGFANASSDNGCSSGAENRGDVFLGVAFYDFKYKKLVADKVFCR